MARVSSSGKSFLTKIAPPEDFNLPLGALLAFEDGTSLRVGLPQEAQSIPFPAGSIFLFRQDLPHGGMAYAEENFRLHAYLEPDSYKGKNNVVGIVL